MHHDLAGMHKRKGHGKMLSAVASEEDLELSTGGKFVS